MRGRGSRKDDVSVIEAAYRSASTDDAWLTSLIEAAEPEIGEGLGVCAYVYDASRAPVKVGAFVHSSDSPIPPEAITGAVQQTDDDYIARTWRSLSFAMASEVASFRDLPAAKGLCDLGVYDMLAINAFDPSGVGVWLGAPLPRERKPRPEEVRKWTRIAAHLVTAFRLRRGAPATSKPAAVLSPNGKVEHAEADASSKPVRDALRTAVERIERARGPLRKRDPEQALDLWKGLVNARFSLVDRFESNGKRYIVAVENEPAAPGPEALSQRERQVLAAAATGRSNKLIAYELGLSDSTVRVLIARASQKLGVTTRRESVAVHLAHQRAARLSS